MNISKRIPTILKLIKENSTKVEIYMSYKAAGDDFDPYEKNYTYYNTNPLTIKAYVTEVSPEGLVWKAYGLKEMGAKEIFCDSKYENWFRLCNKVKIRSERKLTVLRQIQPLITNHNLNLCLHTKNQ